MNQPTQSPSHNLSSLACTCGEHRDPICPQHGNPPSLRLFVDVVEQLLGDVECYCAEYVAASAPCFRCQLVGIRARMTDAQIAAIDSISAAKWWTIYRLVDKMVSQINESEFSRFVDTAELCDIRRAAQALNRELTDPDERDA